MLLGKACHDCAFTRLSPELVKISATWGRASPGSELGSAQFRVPVGSFHGPCLFGLGQLFPNQQLLMVLRAGHRAGHQYASTIPAHQHFCLVPSDYCITTKSPYVYPGYVADAAEIRHSVPKTNPAVEISPVLESQSSMRCPIASCPSEGRRLSHRRFSYGN